MKRDSIFFQLFFCQVLFPSSLFITFATGDPAPSNNVKAVHNSPRYGGDNTFSFKYDYFVGVASVPVIVGGLGILSIFIFQFILMTRCCCKMTKCNPPNDIEEVPTQSTDAIFVIRGEDYEYKQGVIKKRTFLLRLYSLFTIFALITIHIIYYGNYLLTKVVTGMISVLQFLKDNFISIAKAADALTADSSIIANDITNSATKFQANPNCNSFGITFDGLANNTNTFTSNSLSISNLIHPVTDALDTGSSYLQTYAIDDKNLVIYCTYAVITALVLCYFILRRIRVKLAMQILIGITEIVVIVLTILACLLFVFLQIAADLCMSPTSLLLNQLSGSLYTTAAYFIDCKGTNPVSGYLTILSDVTANFPSNVTAQINSKLNPASPYYAECSANLSAIFTINSTLADMNNQLTIISSDLDCAAISRQWHNLIDDDLCTYAFDGLFTITLVFFLTAGFLFATICVSSVMYQYFGKHWGIHHSSEENDGLVLVSGRDSFIQNGNIGRVDEEEDPEGLPETAQPDNTSATNATVRLRKFYWE